MLLLFGYPILFFVGIAPVSCNYRFDKLDRYLYARKSSCRSDSAACHQSQWEGECQTGKIQSPIDLEGATDSEDDWKIATANINTAYLANLRKFTLKNNGHTVQLLPDSNGEKPMLSWPLIGGNYHLQQVHFHWGSQNCKGSEHTLDGKSSAMEMHLVHFNNRYKNIREAIQSEPNGTRPIVVIGIFIQTDWPENVDFAGIVDNLGKITKPESEVVLKQPIALSKLLPITWRSKRGSKIFLYYGSLTTPPCTEAVTWIVFQDPVYLSPEQVQAFRTLEAWDGSKMSENFRRMDKMPPTEPRTVERYKLLVSSDARLMICELSSFLKQTWILTLIVNVYNFG